MTHHYQKKKQLIRIKSNSLLQNETDITEEKKENTNNNKL